MKKLIIFFAFVLAGVVCMAQIPNVDQYQATLVTSDTITSDTGYIFLTYRNSTWNTLIKFAGVTTNDTVWIKMQQSSDNGTTWSNYANLDSVQITATKTYQVWEDPAGALGTHLRVYVNLAAQDTVIVTTLVETLKRIY